MADDDDRLRKLLRFGSELVDESHGWIIRLAALASVAGCLGLFMLTNIFPIALLVPVLPAVLILFTARPRTPIPAGTPTDAGWTMGHPWIEVGGHRHFVTEQEMAERVGERYALMQAEPAAIPDHAGFSMNVQRSVPFLPDPDWVATMTRDTVIRGVFLTLMGVTFGAALWNIGGALVADSLEMSWVGAAFAVGMSAIYSVLGAAVGTACISVLYAIEIAMLQQVLHAVWTRLVGDGGSTPVTVRGRVLTTGAGEAEQRFHLDEPGRLITLITDGSDGVLTLRNERESVEIRGHTGQLAWIRDVLEARPVDQAGRDAVPESLRAMARRRAGEAG